MDKKGNTDKKGRDVWMLLAFISGLGIHCAMVVGVAIFLGRQVDERFGTHPWGAISGIVLGVVAAIWTIYKKLLGKP